MNDDMAVEAEVCKGGTNMDRMALEKVSRSLFAVDDGEVRRCNETWSCHQRALMSATPRGLRYNPVAAAV